MRISGQPPPSRGVSPPPSYAAYGAGLFSNGQWDMLAVLVPLYAVLAGLSAVEIGLLVSARSVLPVLLSIHGGIVMDQAGTRRLLIWLASAATVLPLLYPASGTFAVLTTLQLAVGFSTSLSMQGAQTLMHRLSGGDTAQLAKFSLACRVGTFAAPLMVGVAWDALGPWAAFALVALWGAGTLAMALLALADLDRPSTSHESAVRRAAAVLMPRAGDHMRALALAAIPAVAFVLVLTFLRNGPGAIQASFYVVYLSEIGLSGTLIGALVSLSELSGAAGALVAPSVARLMRPHLVVLIFVASAILFIVITPLIAQFAILLAIAATLRGLSQGINQPVMFSILARAVGPETQGATVGLRNTVNRLSSIVLPAVMGVAAGAWGLAASFYIVGALLLTGCLVVLIAASYGWASGRSNGK